MKIMDNELILSKLVLSRFKYNFGSSLFLYIKSRKPSKNNLTKLINHFTIIYFLSFILIKNGYKINKIERAKMQNTQMNAL